MKAMGFIWGNRKAYSDIEVVNGLQRREAQVENWFYESAKKYFNALCDSFNADAKVLLEEIGKLAGK